jgi:hypothetical protein
MIESPDQVLIWAETERRVEAVAGGHRLGGYIKYGMKHLYFYVGLPVSLTITFAKYV